MPLRYADYFEIKATETLRTQEKLPPLNSLEKFKLEALHIIRIITRNNILWSIGQGKLLVFEFTSALIALRWPSSLLKVQCRMSYCLICSCIPHFLFLSSNLACMWGSPVHVCTYIWLLFLANLPHIDLIIRPVRRTLREKGSFFLPHMTKVTITKNRINWHHVSLDIINWERHIISAKPPTISYWETFYTIHDRIS